MQSNALSELHLWVVKIYKSLTSSSL